MMLVTIYAISDLKYYLIARLNKRAAAASSRSFFQVWEHVARRVKWADPGLDMQVGNARVILHDIPLRDQGFC